MPTRIRTSWRPKLIKAIPTRLYMKAAKQAAGQSFNTYVISLLCRDLGIAFETLDYTPRPQPNWNKPEGATKKMLVLIPPGLMKQVNIKLRSLEYPVTFAGYVRRLIEKDCDR